MLKKYSTIRWIACGLLLAAAAHAKLLKISDVRYSPMEVAAQRVPVQIEAQVMHLHPRRDGMYLFDGSHGIFVHLVDRAGLYDGLKVGSIVRVEGVTSAGGFVPDIVADRVEVIGWAPLPNPRKFQPFEVHSPSISLDCEWVKVWGRVVGATVLKEYDHILLQLEIHDTKVEVQIPYSPDALEKASALMFQRIEVSAVVGTIYNRHRQMTGRMFLVNSPDDFVILTEDVAAIDKDVRPIETLMRAGVNYQKAMHTQGLVSFADENTVCLRGDQTCLKVFTLGSRQLLPGDYVDVLGFILPRPISPAFRARECRVLERRAPPVPKPVDLGSELNPDWNYELIRTEAVLVNIGESFGMSRFSNGEVSGRVEGGRASLLCRSGERMFEARLPAALEPQGELKPGARLQLTGICNLVPNRDPRWSHFTEGAWMELRKTDGLRVLSKAPWWTTRRLFGAIVMVLALAGLFMAWVILLRKTVTRQTGVIGKQIERESMLNERQRIARELHDTLEQSLAGLTLLLKSCAKQLDGNLEKGKETLRLAQGMLRHCRTESRGSILDLRGGLLEVMDLPAALDKLIQPLADECGAELRVTISGSTRRLKPFAEHHLLRMASEAATNAARHASPKLISVALDYQPAALSLTVSDDGAGFGVDQLPKSRRFGLQGMRERANRIRGQIEIESVIGQGTTIVINLPSTSEWELE